MFSLASNEPYLADSSDRSVTPRYDSGSDQVGFSPYDRIRQLASESAVVVFSVSSCCMCTVVKRLFCSLGVSPVVHELDEEHGGDEMRAVLYRLAGNQPVPVVFVGGKLVGGLETVMSSHISGDLVPLLKEAGALWL